MSDKHIVSQALFLLEASDKVFIRTAKDGLTWPNEWKQYVRLLRGVVRNQGGELPSAPPFPHE